MVQTPTLDAALLSSSRAGADLGRTSEVEYDASPGYKRNDLLNEKVDAYTLQATTAGQFQWF